jgi:hypothetical protein
MFDRREKGLAREEPASEPRGGVALDSPVRDADAAGARLDRVAALAPGPLQIGLLAAVDPEPLDHAGRVELLQAWERASRWVTARQLEAVVAVAGPTATNRDDFAREDVRAALRETGGSWRQDVDLARSLRDRLAPAGAALEAGTLSYPQARALQQETEPLDDAAARAVCDRVLADGRTRTPADFRRRVRAAVIAIDPIGAALRAEGASERRQVSRRVLPDGQGSLDLVGPATAIAAIWAVLTRRAGLTHPDDPRSLDQKRFDAMLDICRTAGTERDLTDLVRIASPSAGDDADCDDGSEGPGDDAASGSRPPRKERRRSSRTGTTAGVFVFADLATWAGLADNPVDLDGYGPIPPGMARECFTDSQWRAVVTDALTGLVASVSDTSYTPSPRTRRHLFAQDRGCLFPGCSAPVCTATPTTRSPTTRAGAPTRTTAACSAAAITGSRRSPAGPGPGWTTGPSPGPARTDGSGLDLPSATTSDQCRDDRPLVCTQAWTAAPTHGPAPPRPGPAPTGRPQVLMPAAESPATR